MSSLLLLATVVLAGCVATGLARRARSRSSGDATEAFSRAMSAITPRPGTRTRAGSPPRTGGSGQAAPRLGQAAPRLARTPGRDTARGPARRRASG